MHTATQMFLEAFTPELDGVSAPVEDLMPDWTTHDRFGIVITEPFGALGASLLIQLAIANFYNVKPARRLNDTAEYPEIYAFHFGGRFGDHGNFDFWPPRKEVFVGDATGIALLEAINSHGISRLALPDGPLSDRAVLRTGYSTWAEEGAAHGRIRSAFAYSSDGAASNADVALSSTHPRVEENLNATLRPQAVLDAFRAMMAEELAVALPGPSVSRDVDVYLERLEMRMTEVSQERMELLIAARARLLAGHSGVSTERYRRTSVDEALNRIAALG